MQQIKKNIVFIHGFLCSPEIWKSFSREFESEFQLHFIKLPGHDGENTPINSIEDLAINIAEKITTLKLKSSHIIGHSLGGYIGGEIVKLKLLNIDSLTLINSTLIEDSLTKKENRNLAIRAVKMAPKRYTDKAIENLFSKKNQLPLKNEINATQTNARKIKKEVVVSYLEAMKNRKSTLTFLKQTPIHFIASTNDKTIDFRLIPQQIEQCNGILTLLENSNHMGFLEEREIVAKAIHRFFISLENNAK